MYLVGAYFEGANASSPMAEYLILLCLASAASRFATYSSVRGSSLGMVEDALQELEHVVNCVVLIVAGGADSQDAIDENSILSFSLALLMPDWGAGWGGEVRQNGNFVYLWKLCFFVPHPLTTTTKTSSTGIFRENPSIRIFQI